MPDALYFFGEFCFVPLLFCLGIAVWAAIGHGIWLVVAAFFREFFKPRGPFTPCANCRQQTRVVNGRCSNCGAAVATGSDADAAATGRHLQSLLNRGRISPEQHRLLQTQLLASERPPASSEQPIEAEIVYLQPVESAAAIANPPIKPPTRLRLPPPPSSPFAPPTRPPPPLAPQPITPLPPLKPSRPLAEVLQAFLEEKNIRWGEILAGLFIVISAVGLIISLRNTLKAIPYFPALMFMIFTVLFHGAGLYSLRKWKLHAVSRVVLIISLLLVPLSFGAGIVLSGSGEARRPLGDPIVLLAIVVALAAFSWVTWSSAQELVKRAAWQLFAVVMGTAVGQIVINRWPVETTAGWPLVALALLPLVSFLIPVSVAIAVDVPRIQLTRRRANRLLLIGGVGLFALLVPMALLLVNAVDKRRALAELAPLLSLAAGGVLALGLTLHRKATSQSLVLWRTAGTSIAILATGSLLALLALAWPWPAMLVAVGVIDAVAFLLLARLLQLPLLHAAAVATFSLAYLVGFHWLRGTLPGDDEITTRSLLAALAQIHGGAALLVWNAVVLGIALWLRQRRALQVSHVYLASAAGIALVTLLLTANAAFAPWMPSNSWPMAASIVFITYAVAILLCVRVFQHAALPIVAAIVWWVALVHLLMFDAEMKTRLEPLSTSLSLLQFPTLLHALTVALVAAVLAGRHLVSGTAEYEQQSASPRWQATVLPLAAAALVSSIIALGFVLVPWTSAYGQRAIELTAMAATWLLLTLVSRQAIGVAATQLALHGAVAMAIAQRWSGDDSTALWYLQAAHLVEQITAVALLATLWCGLRIGTQKFPAVQHLLRSDWPTVDELLLPVASLALLVMGIVGLSPAMAIELGLGHVETETALATWSELVVNPGAWMALAMLLIGFLTYQVERLRALVSLGLVLTAALVPVLLAGLGVDDVAAASMLRWGMGGYLLIATALLALREPLGRLIVRVPWWRDARREPLEVEQLRYVTLLIAAGPIVLITCLAVAISLTGGELGGPVKESFFGRLGLSVSYGVPLLAVVGSLAVYAVRERSSRFMLSAATVFQGAVNLALLLYLKDAQLTYLREAAALSLQVNAIGGAAFALLWQAIDRWIEPSADDRGQFPRLIDWLLAFVTRMVAVIALWAVAAIVVSPAALAPWDLRLAGPLSFLAVALNVIALVWRYGRRLLAISLQGALLLLAGLAAIVALASDIVPWRGFLILETAWLALAVAGTLVAWGRYVYQARREANEPSDASVDLAAETPPPLTLWMWFYTQHVNVVRARLHHALAWQAVLLTVATAALAVYSGWHSPWHPWYSLALLFVVQLCYVGQGLLLRSQRLAYLALISAVATGLVIWGDPQWPQLRGSAIGFHLVDIVGLAIIAAGGIWLAIELHFQRRRGESFDSHTRLRDMHDIAAWLVVAGVLLLTCSFPLSLIDWLSSSDLFVLRTETAAFVGVAGLLLVAMLWDHRGSVIPRLYLWGGAAMVLLIVALPIAPAWRMPAMILAAATYVGLTSHLWKWGADLAGWGLRLGIHDPVAGLVRTSRWLPWVNLAAAVGLAVGAVVLVLVLPQRDMRMAVSVTPLLLAWCASSLAQELRKSSMLLAVYLFGVVAAACAGWADLDPARSSLAWLVHTIRLLMALSFATLVYGLVVPRFIFVAGDWNVAARRAASITGGLAIVSLLFVFGQEVLLYQPHVGVRINDWEIAAVSLVMVALAAGLFSLALLPARDPLSLSEQGRMVYVYAAEAIAALLFAHLYVARPGLFDETLRPYWPYIIVALAFASVGLAELFRRSGIRVLAQPLDRTGGLLPLLPALGIWFLASQTDYSLVLFAIGIVYLLHSWLRQSQLSGLAAALAGNAALWVWLERGDGRSFLEHPQLWLIPPALSVLLAAHLQRRRLDPQAMAAIRYAATLVIYLSSASEMFIVGVGNSLWPPMILALLGLAGTLTGMLLQIRAFLYLGTGFVLLALVSMVAHAAQAIDHVWPWWAFGIGVGIFILVLFGIFEKKRAEVMLLIDRLRQWEK